MVSIQFVAYEEIQNLSSVGRIRKLLNYAKEDKIVLLQGRLKQEEEVELIKATMEEINRAFKGIELAVIHPDDHAMSGFERFRHELVNALMGDRTGFTVIGPASVVKKIKQDPGTIELLTKEPRKRRATKKKNTRKRRR